MPSKSLTTEAVSKCSILFKIKEGDPAMAGLTTGIHLVFRGLKFEPAVPPMAGGKRGRFEIGSHTIEF